MNLDHLFSPEYWTDSGPRIFPESFSTTEPDDTEIEFDKEVFEEARELQQYRIDNEGKLQ